MTLKNFIETFVGKNTLIRLWYKTESGHQMVENGLEMEWKAVTGEHKDAKVLYIKDILVTKTNYPEAVNIVIEI